MRHLDASRSLGVVIGLFALAGISSGTSCLVPNETHCQLDGGDLACEAGEACVVGVGGRAGAIEGARDNGCIARLPDACESDDGACVPVTYGLPVAIRMADLPEGYGDPYTDTVEGIIAKRLEQEDGVEYDGSSSECQELIGAFAPPMCTEGAVGTNQDMFDTLVIIREDAEQDPGTGCAARAAMTTEQAACIRAYNGYLTGYLEEQGVALARACDAGTDTTTGMTTEVDTTATETGESTSTTGNPCMDSEDCKNIDPTRPICMDGVCVPCYEADGDASCAMDCPLTPACKFVGPNAGACVECTPNNLAACTEEKPACPVETCVPCTAHEQCGEAACNFCTGKCLPDDVPEDVVHVGGDMPDFDDLTTAVTETEGDVTIIVHAGVDYNESVLVGSPRVVAFLAADIGPGIEPPRWVRTSGDTPQLTVGPGTTVVMDGLRVSNNASSTVPGLQVSGHACIDRSRIIANSGGGIVAQTNSELVVRNSFVGGSVSGVPALAVEDATATLGNTTVIGGLGALAEALSCTSDSTVTVTDSIVLLESDNSPVTCDPATFDHSASEIDLPGSGNEPGNANIGGFDDTSPWFVNVATGDFHLTPAGAAVFTNIALWTTGDPTTDIDGDLRPTTTDTSDFAGADIP